MSEFSVLSVYVAQTIKHPSGNWKRMNRTKRKQKLAKWGGGQRAVTGGLWIDRRTRRSPARAGHAKQMEDSDTLSRGSWTFSAPQAGLMQPEGNSPRVAIVRVTDFHTFECSTF